MKKILFKGTVSFALCLMLFALCSYAGVPGRINYQGRLKEGGVEVNGVKKMEFKIYPVVKGGSSIWSSGSQNVLINNSLFNYQLGSNQSLSDIEWDKGPYYLEVIVEGVILTPREELTGVAYALSATRACALTAPDGEPKDAVYVDNEGNVGIGTMSPNEKLEVAGNLRVNGNFILVNGGYYTRQIQVQCNTADYSAGTSWKLGPVFPTIFDFKAGSLVKLSYHIPMRNDSIYWGGGYIEPQISFDGGSTWNSLGSSGYDGAVMNHDSQSVGSYFNSILIDPDQSSNFSVTVRFYFCSYDSTVYINQSHDINTVSGTASIMSGVNGQQHYSKIIVQEFAPLQ